MKLTNCARVTFVTQLCQELVKKSKTHESTEPDNLQAKFGDKDARLVAAT
jgi:hypothetical protein